MSAYTKAANWCVSLDGRKYITVRPLSWELGRKESGYIVTVPRDYVFDVSIPWFARWIFDPHDPAYLKAAALHDCLLDRQWERVSAAAVFHNALKADQVSLWRRLTMWLAVSLFRFR